MGNKLFKITKFKKGMIWKTMVTVPMELETLESNYYFKHFSLKFHQLNKYYIWSLYIYTTQCYYIIENNDQWTCNEKKTDIPTLIRKNNYMFNAISLITFRIKMHCILHLM